MTKESAKKLLDLGYTKKWILAWVKANLGEPVKITKTLVLSKEWVVYKDQLPPSEAKVEFLKSLDSVTIWGDGSGTTADKEAGIGVFIEYFRNNILLTTQEISAYIGKATSNKAELTAIYQGLRQIPYLPLQIEVRSDSLYAINSCIRFDWAATKNAQMVALLRDNVKHRRDICFQHVKGHSGVPQNEICDKLAKKGRLNGPKPD